MKDRINTQNKHRFNFLLTLLFIGLFSILSSCDSTGLYLDGKKETTNHSAQVFYLPTGTDLAQLVEMLEKEGLISNDKQSLINVGEYKKLDEKRIAPGKYVIQPSTDFKTLLNGFTKNSLGNGNFEVEVNVTFNNCRDIPQLAGKVAKHIEADSAALVNYILDASTVKKYGFNKHTIPALFLPDTYRMYWDTDAETFVSKMASEFKKFWNEERSAKLSQVGLKSQSEAVTVASIVYKEQDKHAEEWPIISGLYLNRLKKGWKLESDPTFRFCWGDELKDVKRLLNVHRKIDCPYNTYLYAGLPPGPICIPAAKVIDAVLNPTPHNYVFMCAKPDGNGLHNFATTLAQHNRNAAKYHRWLTENKVK